jgi:hypothetical protein
MTPAISVVLPVADRVEYLEQAIHSFTDMLIKGATFYGLQKELVIYRRHPGNLTHDPSGTDVEKQPIRELLVSRYFPCLTHIESRALLRAFMQKPGLRLSTACESIVAIEKAAQETRSCLGEDRAELNRILHWARQRIQKAFGRLAAATVTAP